MINVPGTCTSAWSFQHEIKGARRPELESVSTDEIKGARRPRLESARRSEIESARRSKIEGATENVAQHVRW